MEKNTLSGRIIMVQESRFRLTGSDGKSYLFSLSSSATTDERMLLELLAGGRQVQVEYTGEPDMDTGIARKIMAFP